MKIKDIISDLSNISDVGQNTCDTVKCGNEENIVKKVAVAMFGTVDAVFTGEACEWTLAEYARDAGQLGINKSLFIMGHCGSERDGMRLLADNLQEKYSDLEIKYFECGEVYSNND